jgi:hypothetical protein
MASGGGGIRGGRHWHQKLMAASNLCVENLNGASAIIMKAIRHQSVCLQWRRRRRSQKNASVMLANNNQRSASAWWHQWLAANIQSLAGVAAAGRLMAREKNNDEGDNDNVGSETNGVKYRAVHLVMLSVMEGLACPWRKYQKHERRNSILQRVIAATCGRRCGGKRKLGHQWRNKCLCDIISCCLYGISK